MHIYMSAPEGDSRSTQELADILEKVHIKVDDWAIVSEEPLEVEAIPRNRSSLLRARGKAGRLRFVALENPKERILNRLCPVLEKRGWEIDGE